MSLTIYGLEYDINNTNTLGLCKKNLTDFPTEICKLKYVKRLYLNENKLYKLPSEIGNLINLQRLWLYNNNLTSLPVEIGKLKYLKFLDLTDNQLKELPKEIGNLNNLQTLRLWNNHLTSLPSEIGNLKKLEVLYLQDNNIKKLPKKILNIKESLIIDKTSYDIDNMDLEAEILILTSLNTEINNLPITLKEIWLKEGFVGDTDLIKVPFGCEIKFFE